MSLLSSGGIVVRCELSWVRLSRSTKRSSSWRTAVLNGGDFEIPRSRVVSADLGHAQPVVPGRLDDLRLTGWRTQPVAAGGLARPRPASGPGSLPDRAVDLLQRRFGATVRRARNAKASASSWGLLAAGGIDYDRREPPKPVDSRSAARPAQNQPATAGPAPPPKPLGPPLLKALPLVQSRTEAQAVADLFAQTRPARDPGCSSAARRAACDEGAARGGHTGQAILAPGHARVLRATRPPVGDRF